MDKKAEVIESLGFDEFARRYCERQEQTPDGLRAILTKQKALYSPTGWMLLQCIVLDSSRLGSMVILPYGGSATIKEVPDRPFSPRGLCSDISEVVATMPAEVFP